MSSTRGSIRLVAGTQREFAWMPGIRMRQSRPTRPSPTPSATASTSRLISSCWRATCHFIKARWETAWSMNSPSTTTADASYDIENFSLEYEIVIQPELARMIANQYNGRLEILYDRILRHRKISKDKSDTLWNINLNVPARSMNGVLMLFEDVAAQRPFARNTEAFYNPKITKVEVTIEGIPNQLFSQGMRAYQMLDEARKLFAASPGRKRHPEVAIWRKTLVSLTLFALWLDLRTTDDDRLHGSGRRLKNASEGVTLQLTKKAKAAGALNIYLYILMDAQLNLEDGRLISAVY